MNLQRSASKFKIRFFFKTFIITKNKGPATRNDIVNDFVDDARADAIFATLKSIVDDGSSTISSTISLRVAGPLNLFQQISK